MYPFTCSCTCTCTLLHVYTCMYTQCSYVCKGVMCVCYLFSLPSFPFVHSTLLYELVLLGKPFKNVSRECVIWRVGSGRFQPLSLLPRDRLRGIIQRCWQLSPESRPTFKSILTDVEQNVSAASTLNLVCSLKYVHNRLASCYLSLHVH